MAERYPTNPRCPEVWKEIRETNEWIRESQMARAYAFPHAFAPEGKLREVEPISYMVLMNQHYAFRTSQQDLTLELREENEDGEVAIRTKVGEAYSVDFQWDEYETLRLHLIAVRQTMIESSNIMTYSIWVLLEMHTLFP